MMHRLLIVPAMLLGAYLLFPCAHVIVYPVMAAILFCVYKSVFWVLKKLFKKLDEKKYKLIYLILFLLLLLPQFFYFTSRSYVLNCYLGNLSSNITVLDHSFQHRYDPSFAFLFEGSDKTLDELLTLKAFGQPSEIPVNISQQYDWIEIPKQFRPMFRQKQIIKYQFVNEHGTFFQVLTTHDKKYIVYKIQHT